MSVQNFNAIDQPSLKWGAADLLEKGAKLAEIDHQNAPAAVLVTPRRLEMLPIPTVIAGQILYDTSHKVQCFTSIKQQSHLEMVISI